MGASGSTQVCKMDEIRKTALALYKNFSPESQAGVREFFNKMDADGSGLVTKEEFVKYLEKNGVNLYNPEFFSLLDKDGNGTLDFEEVIAFFYFTNFRETWCKGGCSKFIFDLYFTCVCCYVKSGSKPYDLCLGCFEKKSYTHEHKEFLDNYAMLNALKKEAGETGSGTGSGTGTAGSQLGISEKVLKLLGAFNTGYAFSNAISGAAAAGLCTIM